MPMASRNRQSWQTLVRELLHVELEDRAFIDALSSPTPPRRHLPRHSRGICVQYPGMIRPSENSNLLAFQCHFKFA
jgi:hypothetical protein